MEPCSVHATSDLTSPRLLLAYSDPAMLSFLELSHHEEHPLPWGLHNGCLCAWRTPLISGRNYFGRLFVLTNAACSHVEQACRGQILSNYGLTKWIAETWNIVGAFCIVCLALICLHTTLSLLLCPSQPSHLVLFFIFFLFIMVIF